MSDTSPAPTKAKKHRSPSFPFIPLQTAVERLEAFEKHFGRHPTPANRVGPAWSLKEGSSQTDQTLAALRSFGFVTYDGTGPKRLVSVSAEGRTYLRANQDSLREASLKQAALRPKIIRKFWRLWDRPVDAVALDTLILENAFSDNGARSFLHVYDDTVTYAKLSTADKVEGEDEGDSGSQDEENGGKLDNPPKPAPAVTGKVKVMDSERVAFTEEGQPGQYLKLIASGEVDDTLLEALEDFVKRQRKRLAAASKTAPEN